MDNVPGETGNAPLGHPHLGAGTEPPRGPSTGLEMVRPRGIKFSYTATKPIDDRADHLVARIGREDAVRIWPGKKRTIFIQSWRVVHASDAPRTNR
jgi:hypothetical protein